MTTPRLAVAEAPDESVTSTVKLNVPAALGVPPRIPSLVRVRPPGSEPAEIVHAYPLPVPPAAVRVDEYDSLIVPAGRDVAVTFSGVALEEDEELPPQP
jgi:hypothetical protein